LLPAPLCVAGLRWRRATTVRISLLHIVGIVTAFTIGHSITLTLAAMDFVHVPGIPVEVRRRRLARCEPCLQIPTREVQVVDPRERWRSS